MLAPRRNMVEFLRNVSRTARLTRFRTTALPIFFVTVIPNRGGPPPEHT